MRIHRHRYRQPKTNVPQYRVNEKILAPTVRVIDDAGQPLGVIPTSEAIAAARQREFDLVEVSPKAEPPVCRFLNFGHFKYQKEKEVRKQKAQSHEVEVKGVRLSLRIGEHDLEVRRQQAKKFLERGDKVKIELVMRGREKGHQDLAREVIQRLVEKLQQDYTIRVEQPVTKQDGRLIMVVGRG